MFSGLEIEDLSSTDLRLMIMWAVNEAMGPLQRSETVIRYIMRRGCGRAASDETYPKRDAKLPYYGAGARLLFRRAAGALTSEIFSDEDVAIHTRQETQTLAGLKPTPPRIDLLFRRIFSK